MFVIYDEVTERLFKKNYVMAIYNTERSAKAARTRFSKNYPDMILKVMEYSQYTEMFDPFVTVYNNITGDGKTPIKIRRSQLGGCCDPSTELYHCM